MWFSFELIHLYRSCFCFLFPFPLHGPWYDVFIYVSVSHMDINTPNNSIDDFFGYAVVLQTISTIQL